jgi:hypothetical protein
MLGDDRTHVFQSILAVLSYEVPRDGRRAGVNPWMLNVASGAFEIVGYLQQCLARIRGRACREFTGLLG